jgi:hypothetical protein
MKIIPQNTHENFLQVFNYYKPFAAVFTPIRKIRGQIGIQSIFRFSREQRPDS